MTLPDSDATRLGDMEPLTAPVGPGSESWRNALPSGTRLLEFEILEVVGEGGFGIVYRAYDHNLHREVALKEFLPASLAQRAGPLNVSVTSQRNAETFAVALRSFVNEARLLAQFDHPSLVKVYRFWEANGTAYMVMPYHRVATLGATLRDRKRQVDEPWLARVLGDLLDALEVLHAQRCLHRDIAPENILMLEDGRPLLLDFGAARRVIGDSSRALTVIYRPDYAPIEQHAEVASMKQGPWTDIYALSAVAHFAITGSPPPPAVSRLMQDTYVPLARSASGRFSHQLLQGIDRGLALQPDERPQTVADMRTALGLQAPSPPAAREAAPYVRHDAERVPKRAASPLKGIVITYRRHDAADHAGRLFDALAARFGTDRVFMDVTDRKPGQDFVAEVDRALAASDYLLAVIGPNWADAVDAAGRRRLDDPDDSVAREIARGLASPATVIPVLVRGARMPAAESLPPTVRPLAGRRAIELTDKRWDSDVRGLIAALAPEGSGPDVAASSGASTRAGAKTNTPAQPPAHARASNVMRVLMGGVALVAVLVVGLWIRNLDGDRSVATPPPANSFPRQSEPVSGSGPMPDGPNAGALRPEPAEKGTNDGLAVGANKSDLPTQPPAAAPPVQTKPQVQPPPAATKPGAKESVERTTASTGAARSRDDITIAPPPANGSRAKTALPRETASGSRALSARCADLLDRAQIGEALSDADMSYLKQQCH